MSELSERLREAHPNSQQYALGSNTLLEAAQEIESLQAQLSEAWAERERLREQLEGAERDRYSFADGLLIADFYTECPECGECIDNGPHHPDCKYTDVIARARSIVDRQQPQGGEDE